MTHWFHTFYCLPQESPWLARQCWTLPLWKKRYNMQIWFLYRSQAARVIIWEADSSLVRCAYCRMVEKRNWHRRRTRHLITEVSGSIHCLAPLQSRSSRRGGWGVGAACLFKGAGRCCRGEWRKKGGEEALRAATQLSNFWIWGEKTLFSHIYNNKEEGLYFYCFYFYLFPLHHSYIFFSTWWEGRMLPLFWGAENWGCCACSDETLKTSTTVSLLMQGARTPPLHCSTGRSPPPTQAACSASLHAEGVLGVAGGCGWRLGSRSRKGWGVGLAAIVKDGSQRVHRAGTDALSISRAHVSLELLALIFVDFFHNTKLCQGMLFLNYSEL